MEYYIFFEDYAAGLEQIGYVKAEGRDMNSITGEIWDQIDAYIKDILHRSRPLYVRTWNNGGATIVDFGSHSQFFQIRPEINLIS